MISLRVVSVILPALDTAGHLSSNFGGVKKCERWLRRDRNGKYTRENFTRAIDRWIKQFGYFIWKIGWACNAKYRYMRDFPYRVEGNAFGRGANGLLRPVTSANLGKWFFFRLELHEIFSCAEKDVRWSLGSHLEHNRVSLRISINDVQCCID